MSETPHLRLAIVGIVVVSLFSALFARLWYLEVLDSGSFVQAATSNQVRLVYEEAPRGRILDRNGNVLVDNQRSQAITVNKAILNRSKLKDEAKAKLAALLGITLDDLDKRINDVRFSQYKPVPVLENATAEQFTYVREHQAELPGVEATIVSQRTYPNGELAAHLLGYVGEINDSELTSHKRDGYRLGDTIGKSGAELVYESDLRGQAGVTKLQVNSAGDVLGGPLDVQAPVPGHDVQLTVDLNLQRLVEDSLVQGLEAAREQVDRNDGKHFAAPAGSVVVLDPRDGSVLAMASYPTYNPADFINGIKPDVFNAMQQPASYFPLTNRAIQGQYAPGSTFKLVTATAATEKGLITPNSTIRDTGSYTVPNCKGEQCSFRNAGGNSYGLVDLRRAITVSSDVYFYQLGARFWLGRGQYGNAIQDTARAYGFAAHTGIPLAGEQKGFIPDPELKKKRHEQNPTAFPYGGWFTGDNINMAIGQGDVLATPLQLANAYAAFGNGGTRFEPKIGARVLDRDGNVLREEPAKPAGKIDIAPATRAAILQGLEGVVAAKDGTASAAFAGYPDRVLPVAGKTGTAQVNGKKDTAVFAAFAPADNPQYAVSVFMEESGFGGSAAAPVARRIFEGLAGQPPGPIHLGTGSD